MLYAIMICLLVTLPRHTPVSALLMLIDAKGEARSRRRRACDGALRDAVATSSIEMTSTMLAALCTCRARHVRPRMEERSRHAAMRARDMPRWRHAVAKECNVQYPLIDIPAAHTLHTCFTRNGC